MVLRDEAVGLRRETSAPSLTFFVTMKSLFSSGVPHNSKACPTRRKSQKPHTQHRRMEHPASDEKHLVQIGLI
jgi:hypothetical protein